MNRLVASVLLAIALVSGAGCGDDASPREEACGSFCDCYAPAGFEAQCTAACEQDVSEECVSCVQAVADPSACTDVTQCPCDF